MRQLIRHLRQLLLLLPCLLVMPAFGEGCRFTLRAGIDPSQYPAAQQALMTGLGSLLDTAELQGTLAYEGGSFALDATLLLGEGRTRSRTAFGVYGTSSHWGVRSSLLGAQELMLNNAALLPFGQKAADWLGLPLDKAALLVPYTHEYALRNVADILAPLFPAQNGRTYLPRTELDGMAKALLTLCDEDAALNRWLNATGLYRTVIRYLRAFLELPVLAVPGVSVTRTDSCLKWDVYFINILTLSQTDTQASLRFSVPTLIDIQGSAARQDARLTGKLMARVDDSIQVDAAFSVPFTLPAAVPGIYLSVDAQAPGLPENGFHLSVEGEALGSTLILRQLSPDTGRAMLTLTAEVADYVPEAVPAYAPEDLTGMNLLSVNGDSLRELMTGIRRPLLSGLFDLLVAAPPEAVQSLMDWAEDAGLIDLLTDALSGGNAY